MFAISATKYLLHSKTLLLSGSGLLVCFLGLDKKGYQVLHGVVLLQLQTFRPNVSKEADGTCIA